MPMRLALAGGLMACMCAASSAVYADQIHLVGGTQLEGKATRQGDKVVIDMESGQITLDADGVERIERGPTNVERYEELAAKLKPGDVHARMALADFCRDHDMRARERELLHQVIEIDRDHPQARARLGYVKTATGWTTRDEQLRAQGYVREAGQWIAPERALELQRLRAQSQAAQDERDKARADLELKKLEIEQRRRELEGADRASERSNDAAQPGVNTYGFVGYGAAYGVRPVWRAHSAPNWHGSRAFPEVSSPAARPFPINGASDPRNTSWPINGVRDPRSY